MSVEYNVQFLLYCLSPHVRVYGNALSYQSSHGQFLQSLKECEDEILELYRVCMLVLNATVIV